jgi:hypothetical protein
MFRNYLIFKKKNASKIAKKERPCILATKKLIVRVFIRENFSKPKNTSAETNISARVTVTLDAELLMRTKSGEKLNIHFIAALLKIGKTFAS